MRNASILLSGFFAVLVPFAASAHDQLPANWCPAQGTTPVIVSSYSFTPAQLQAYRDTNKTQQSDIANCTKVTDCGIVDDWYWANRMIQRHCAAGTTATSSIYRSNVPLQNGNIAVASSPASFLSPNHHAEYRFANGNLVGACYACVPSSPSPQPGTGGAVSTN